MNNLSQAEVILQGLGVSSFEDIDLEAIAYCLGAKVVYRPLDGCEARITGSVDKAIITINENSSYRRQRFSLAHELGHWCCHRGKHLVCNVPDINGPSQGVDPEQEANRFASDLLMPNYLFKPALKAVPKLTLKSLQALSDQFNTSLTATAIRVIKSDCYPAVLTCYDGTRRRWFQSSPSVPQKWFPVDTLDADSIALDVLFNKQVDNSFPRKSPADIWFNNSSAGRYEIFEQSWKPNANEVLTILILDPKMLDI